MRAGSVFPIVLLFLSVSPIAQAECGGGGPWIPPYVEEVAATSIGWGYARSQDLFGSAGAVCASQKPPPNDSVSLCSAANPLAPGEIHACITGRIASIMSCESAFYNGMALPVGEFYRCPDPERIWLGPYRTPGGGVACQRTVYQPFVPPSNLSACPPIARSPVTWPSPNRVLWAASKRRSCALLSPATVHRLRPCCYALARPWRPAAAGTIITTKLGGRAVSSRRTDSSATPMATLISSSWPRKYPAITRSRSSARRWSAGPPPGKSGLESRTSYRCTTRIFTRWWGKPVRTRVTIT